MTTATRTIEAQGVEFAQTVMTASGAKPLSCLQCGKCSSGCPVSALVDIRPHELVRLVQLGASDEVLTSCMLWECTSCETCVTRCPQAVDIPAVIDALRRMSRATAKVTKGSTVPVFNDIFLRTVRRYGRMHEMSLMASYKLRTGDLFTDAGKLPMMLRKGKLPLLPKLVRGAAERKRLFARAQKTHGRARGGGRQS
jgi:heterodisulfide reductase subunit C2